MKLYPYKKIIIRTTRTPENIQEILSQNVESKKIFLMSSRNVPFKGEYNETGFRITPIISYRNSFIPVITGQISREGKIEITMRLHGFVMAFMSFWLYSVGGFALMGWGTLLSGLPDITEDSLMFAMIPTGMFLFGVSLAILPFWFEANRAEKKLKELFR